MKEFIAFIRKYDIKYDLVKLIYLNKLLVSEQIKIQNLFYSYINMYENTIKNRTLDFLWTYKYDKQTALELYKKLLRNIKLKDIFSINNSKDLEEFCKKHKNNEQIFNPY